MRLRRWHQRKEAGSVGRWPLRLHRAPTHLARERQGFGGQSRVAAAAAAPVFFWSSPLARVTSSCASHLWRRGRAVLATEVFARVAAILSLVCVLGTWLAAGTAALEAAESIQGAAAAAATNQSSRASQTNQRLCISHMRQAPVLMVVGVQKGGTSFLGAVFKTLFCGPVAGEPHFWSDMCLAVASVGPSTRDRYLERYSRSLPPCTRSHGCLFAWSRHLGHPPSCQRLSCCFEILLREQWSGFLQCAFIIFCRQLVWNFGYNQPQKETNPGSFSNGGQARNQLRHRGS